jgi:hypothetical protein
MAQRVMRKDSAFLNDFEERQHEISGNPKEFRARRDPSNLAAVMSLARASESFNRDRADEQPGSHLKVAH